MSYTLAGFEGKVAVVTGVGRMRSIGRPIALALAQAGCDVVLTGTDRRVLLVVSDVSNPEAVRS